MTAQDITQYAKDDELLPTGSYVMKCTDVKKDKTAKEDHCWVLTLEVTQGEHVGFECLAWLTFPDKDTQTRKKEKFLGKKLYHCLSAFGVPNDQLKEINKHHRTHQQLLVDRTVLVEIKHTDPTESKNGEAYATPKSYARDPDAAPPAENDIKLDPVVGKDIPF